MSLVSQGTGGPTHPPLSRPSRALFFPAGPTQRIRPRREKTQVCAFLAPLLQEGLVKAHAEAVCDLPGLGKFAEVPLMLSIKIEEGLFALDPGTMWHK